MTYNRQVYKTLLIISFIGFILCLILAVICQAEPFIRSAPQKSFMNDSGVLFYQISYDNGETWEKANHINPITDEIRLMHSLSSLATGDHILLIRSGNPWGVSNAVPFTLKKELPQSPIGIELVFEEFEIVDIIP